jgi:hypothetical protein
MQRRIVFSLAGALAIVMGAWTAQAMPSAAAKPGYENNTVTLVAQRCGVGWHWNARFRRCVRN